MRNFPSSSYPLSVTGISSTIGAAATGVAVRLTHLDADTSKPRRPAGTSPAGRLLPVSQEALNDASQLRYLGITYIWVGQNDSALEALSNAARLPSDTSFGQLKLHLVWDPLRGDPRFEKIIASLAGSNEVHA